LRCEGCIAFHAKAAIELVATREEVMEMLGICMHKAVARHLLTPLKRLRRLMGSPTKTKQSNRAYSLSFKHERGPS